MLRYFKVDKSLNRVLFDKNYDYNTRFIGIYNNVECKKLQKNNLLLNYNNIRKHLFLE